MADDRLYRARPVDLEVRSDGRTIAGIAVPFDEPTDITEGTRTYSEVFRRGAFARTITERGPARVKFFALHQSEKLPLGRATKLREDPDGLYVELRASKTRASDEILELVRDGALDGLSIGFSPVRERWSRARDAVERIAVKLHEISAVTWPAYTGARIVAVRSDLSDLVPPGLDVTVAAARLALLRQGRTTS